MKHYSFIPDTRQPNSEFKRGQIRSKLGLATIIESDNTKRRHSRAKENAKFGLNALLVAVVITGWATCFNFAIAPYFVTLAMIYALCCIIARPESPNEN